MANLKSEVIQGLRRTNSNALDVLVDSVKFYREDAPVELTSSAYTGNVGTLTEGAHAGREGGCRDRNWRAPEVRVQDLRAREEPHDDVAGALHRGGAARIRFGWHKKIPQNRRFQKALQWHKLVGHPAAHAYGHRGGRSEVA